MKSLFVYFTILSTFIACNPKVESISNSVTVQQKAKVNRLPHLMSSLWEFEKFSKTKTLNHNSLATMAFNIETDSSMMMSGYSFVNNYNCRIYLNENGVLEHEEVLSTKLTDPNEQANIMDKLFNNHLNHLVKIEIVDKKLVVTSDTEDMIFKRKN